MEKSLLRQKLREKINQKKTIRSHQKSNDIKKIQEGFSDLMKDKRITPHMLELYKNAILNLKNINIPKPNEILDNPNKYKDQYKIYVKEIIQTVKDQKLGIDSLKTLMHNEYTDYLAYMLNLKDVPNFLKV